ncbi:hypothetical protein VPH35_082752 [Triticum aestivum]
MSVRQASGRLGDPLCPGAERRTAIQDRGAARSLVSPPSTSRAGLPAHVADPWEVMGFGGAASHGPPTRTTPAGGRPSGPPLGDGFQDPVRQRLGRSRRGGGPDEPGEQISRQAGPAVPPSPSCSFYEQEQGSPSRRSPDGKGPPRSSFRLRAWPPHFSSHLPAPSTPRPPPPLAYSWRRAPRLARAPPFPSCCLLLATHATVRGPVSLGPQRRRSITVPSRCCCCILGWEIEHMCQLSSVGRETKMAREGDVPDNETEGSANPISRRHSKRAAKRQPHGDDKDGDGEDDDGGERFLLVKLQRRKVRMKAVSKGVDATSSAAAAEGGEGNEEDNAERQSQAGRIRASPGRLVKLNNKLSPLQKSPPLPQAVWRPGFMF